jgi:hypothetical protein
MSAAHVIWISRWFSLQLAVRTRAQASLFPVQGVFTLRVTLPECCSARAGCCSVSIGACCWMICSRSCSWVTQPKSLRFSSPDCAQLVSFWTRLQDVRWNICEDINYFSIQFSSLILDVVLLALFRVSVVVPSPISRADSLFIVMRSWSS